MACIRPMHYWVECPCLQSDGVKSLEIAEVVQLSGWSLFLILIGAKTPPNSSDVNLIKNTE